MTDDPFAMHLKITKFKFALDKLETWEEIENLCKETFPPPVIETPSVPRIADPQNPYRYRPGDYNDRETKVTERFYSHADYAEMDSYQNNPHPQAVAFEKASNNLLKQLYDKRMIQHTIQKDLMTRTNKVCLSLEVVIPQKKHKVDY